MSPAIMMSKMGKNTIILFVFAVTCLGNSLKSQTIPVEIRLMGNTAKLIDKDIYFKSHSDFLLFYVFGAGIQKGCLIVMENDVYKMFKLLNNGKKIVRFPISKKASSTIINNVRRIGFRNVSLAAFDCKNEGYIPHEFYVLLMVKAMGNLIENKLAYFGCIDSNRHHRQYPFIISLFAFINENPPH